MSADNSVSVNRNGFGVAAFPDKGFIGCVFGSENNVKLKCVARENGFFGFGGQRAGRVFGLQLLFARIQAAIRRIHQANEKRSLTYKGE